MMSRILYFVAMLFLTCLPAHSINTWQEQQSDSIVSPEYPGGDKALSKFLKKNLQYPELMRQLEAQGECYIEFVVNETGELLSLKAKDCRVTHINPGSVAKYSDEELKNIKKECAKLMAKEGFRLVRKMRKWQPGSVNGKPVSVKFTLPIHFGLM